MIKIYHFLMAGILVFVLLKYIFPKLIYVLCEIVLVLDRITDYSEEKKDDWGNLLITRLFYMAVYISASGLLYLFGIPMLVLMYIEVFGGFVDEAVLNFEEEH